MGEQLKMRKPFPGETMSLRLVSPSVDYIDSYRGYLCEFEERGEELYPFTTDYPHDDAHGFVARLVRESKGQGLAAGFVAHSTYWLMQNDQVVVGVSNLRHRLNPHLRHEGGHIGYGVRPTARGNAYATRLLGLTLRRAADLGITRVLVVSAMENEPSIRTILRNGGVLEAEGVVASDGTRMNRYWIDPPPPIKAVA